MIADGDIALAIRFGDQFAPTAGTIAEHRQMITKHGAAYFGKMGQPIRISRFVADTSGAVDDQLLLVKGTGAGRRAGGGWFATVESVTTSVPASEIELVPFYYRQRASKIPTWFKITSMREASSEELHNMVVMSSGRPLMSILNHSSQTAFYVQMRQSD